MKRLSKALYFWSYLFAQLVSISLLAPTLRSMSPMKLGAKIPTEVIPTEAIPFYAGGLLFAIYSGIIMFLFIYNIWKIIPAAYARTTPGKAVGYMFIPLYSFFWIFQVLYGWAIDFNMNARRLNRNWPIASESIGRAASILWVVGSLVGILTWIGIPFQLITAMNIISLIFMAIFFYKTINVVNALTTEDMQIIAAETAPPKPSIKRGFGIASLVLGILSILTNILGTVPGILGIIFSLIQRKKEPEGFSKAGLILSIIGIAFGAIVAIVIFSR